MMAIVLDSVWACRRGHTGEGSDLSREWALRDISLRIGGGERVAIVGANGGGKTTLLRTICGIYSPERGRVRIHGPVAAVIDLNPGVEKELTGFEVLPIRCALMGMRPAEIRRRSVEIPAIAGIDDDLMGRPLAHWSPGMLLRLEFAVALSIHPAVLALDEVLTVADPNFQARALELMEEVAYNGTAVVMATNNLDQCAQYFDRAIVLERGQVVMDGGINAVIERTSRRIEHALWKTAKVVGGGQKEAW